MQHVPGLYIGNSSLNNRGVFCAQSLSACEVVEICPLIILPATEVMQIDQTILFEYYFDWPDGKGSIGIALGYGSLYNHSEDPNAKVIMDLDSNEIIIETIQSIQSGDEILIDYLDGQRDRTKLWFEAKA